MELAEIKKRVIQILAVQLGVEENVVTDTAQLISDLGADSLDHIEIVMAIEDEFGVEIPDDMAEPFMDSTAAGISAELSKHV